MSHQEEEEESPGLPPSPAEVSAMKARIAHLERELHLKDIAYRAQAEEWWEAMRQRDHMQRRAEAAEVRNCAVKEIGELRLINRLNVEALRVAENERDEARRARDAAVNSVQRNGEKAAEWHAQLRAAEKGRDEARANHDLLARDLYEGMDCAPDCDSYAHNEACPVAYPEAAFRLLRSRLAALTPLADGRDTLRDTVLRLEGEKKAGWDAMVESGWICGCGHPITTDGCCSRVAIAELEVGRLKGKVSACHEILSRAAALFDPQDQPDICADIVAELAPCDDAGVCGKGDGHA